MAELDNPCVKRGSTSMVQLVKQQVFKLHQSREQSRVRRGEITTDFPNFSFICICLFLFYIFFTHCLLRFFFSTPPIQLIDRLNCSLGLKGRDVHVPSVLRVQEKNATSLVTKVSAFMVKYVFN